MYYTRLSVPTRMSEDGDMNNYLESCIGLLDMKDIVLLFGAAAGI